MGARRSSSALPEPSYLKEKKVRDDPDWLRYGAVCASTRITATAATFIRFIHRFGLAGWLAGWLAGLPVLPPVDPSADLCEPFDGQTGGRTDGPWQQSSGSDRSISLGPPVLFLLPRTPNQSRSLPMSFVLYRHIVLSDIVRCPSWPSLTRKHYECSRWKSRLTRTTDGRTDGGTDKQTDGRTDSDTHCKKANRQAASWLANQSVHRSVRHVSEHGKTWSRNVDCCVLAR